MPVDTRSGLFAMRDIVRDLKVFSGEGDRKRIAIDVRGALEGALRSLVTEIRHRRVSLDIQRLPAVRGDEDDRPALQPCATGRCAGHSGGRVGEERDIAATWTAPAVPGGEGPWVWWRSPTPASVRPPTFWPRI